MRVLILPDADMVVRERELLGRLEIGLADEGIRVVQAIPRSLEGHEAAVALAQSVFARPLPFDDTGLPFTGHLRAMLLVRELLAILHDEPGGEGIDVVYALGERSWGMARRVARAMDSGFIIEVFAQRQIARAAALWRAASRETSVLKPMFLTPGEPMAALLRRVVPADHVSVAPWGVHPNQHVPKAVESGPSIVMLATLDHARAVNDMLGLFATLSADLSDLRIMVDADVAHRSGVWKRAGALGLQPRLSVVADLESRHDLVTHADLLLIPQALYEHRSLVLQAMADGMLIVAAADPVTEWLIPGETATVVKPGDPGELLNTLRALLTDRERAAALRASAAAQVRLRWPASGHVRALLASCDGAAAARDAASTRRL